MKYFTPKLLARFRSSEDDMADAAATEWDQASAAYRARFRSVRDRLPVGVRRLAKVSLHDARLIGVAISERRPLFSMIVQPESSSDRTHEALELSYHTIAGTTPGLLITAHDPSAGERRDVCILYDEFDVDEEHSFFTHALLLSDGREIQVRFHCLSVRPVGRVSAPPELTSGETTWPIAGAVS